MKKNIKKDSRPIKIEYTASFKVNRSIELLEFLLLKMNTSRNNVKTLLKNHQVVVNGASATQFNLLLAKDDEVKISKHPFINNNESNDKKTKKRIPRIDIIYEDDDFIAINKPQGLLSVESDKESLSAYSLLYEYMQSVDKKLRPYSLHRIDKETSGVLVFAKNVKIHSMLKLNWNDYVKLREYVAVIEGNLDKKEGTIINYLANNVNNIVYVTNKEEGSKAITNYKVLKTSKEFSLVKCEIDTGKKNQIRVAFNNIGHPIVGDDKYGFTKNPLKRLGLHASALEFVHPVTKEVIRIEAKVPGNFLGLFN